MDSKAFFIRHLKKKYLPIYTTLTGQKYSHDSNFPCIFHIKLHFFSKYYLNLIICQIMSDFEKFSSTKTEKYVVYSSYIFK
jgi:hypothetical protein